MKYLTPMLILSLILYPMILKAESLPLKKGPLIESASYITLTETELESIISDAIDEATREVIAVERPARQQAEKELEKQKEENRRIITINGVIIAFGIALSFIAGMLIGIKQ